MKNITYEKKKAAIICEISAAFDGVSREDGVTLHEGEAMDDCLGPAAEVQARAKDAETRWQDVPAEDISSLSAWISFLDPKGFRYYIPALMTWYLNHIDKVGPDFGSNTFWGVDFYLVGGSRDRLDDYYLSRFKVLNPEQSKAVAHFLEFLVERRDMLDAQEEVSDWAEVLKGQLTPEEAVGWREDREISRKIENEASQALERYWGQFLHQSSA